MTETTAYTPDELERLRAQLSEGHRLADEVADSRPKSTDDDDLSKGFPMSNNTFDEASLRSLLEAAAAAGVNLTGLKAEKQPDGNWTVNLSAPEPCETEKHEH